MTDVERLAEIEARWRDSYHGDTPGISLIAAVQDARWLAVQLRQGEAKLADLRDIARVVAEEEPKIVSVPGYVAGGLRCRYCHWTTTDGQGEHAEDCVVLKARALVALAGQGEDEARLRCVCGALVLATLPAMEAHISACHPEATGSGLGGMHTNRLAPEPWGR